MSKTILTLTMLAMTGAMSMGAPAKASPLPIQSTVEASSGHVQLVRGRTITTRKTRQGVRSRSYRRCYGGSCRRHRYYRPKPQRRRTICSRENCRK